MFTLYLGDCDEEVVLTWLIENIGPLGMTTQASGDYYKQFYAKDGMWVLRTSDVSDVSGQFDTVTCVEFGSKEDALLCHLTWGGSL